MKYPATLMVCLSLIVGLGALAADAPDKIVFEAKNGNTTYDHATHAEGTAFPSKGNCKKCHV